MSKPEDNELEELLGEYWRLAFNEGGENRNHDTEGGDAQRVYSRLIELYTSRPGAAEILAAEQREREACAIIAEMHEHRGVIAQAIRNRGE